MSYRAGLLIRNRRIVRFVVVAVGALVLLVALAAVALDSAAGKRFLMARLASMLAADGLTLETDEIGGSLWSRLTIGRLRLSDADGTLVDATMLELDWTPSRLLARELRVETLAAESLTVERLPTGNSSDETGGSSALLPELPVDLAIDRIAVATLTLGPAVAPAPRPWSRSRPAPRWRLRVASDCSSTFAASTAARSRRQSTLRSISGINCFLCYHACKRGPCESRGR